MFQVASSVKPLLHSNIPTKDIPRNQRFLDARIGASFRHWATASVFRTTRERRFKMVARRSERNLAFKHQLRTCFGIALKHNLDTTRQVFCSRSVRISFERVCFRLHPASSLCYTQTFPPRTYQETKDFWTPE